MPADSPYNAPPVIRALYAVSHALQASDAAPPLQPAKKSGPPNGGKPWSLEDDAQLCALMDEGVELKAIAQQVGRTAFAVETRLVKLGKLPPRVGRFA